LRAVKTFKPVRQRFTVPLVLALYIGLFVIAMSACGGESEEPVSEVQKVVDNGSTYTADDFTAFGFKKSKSYSVTDLPGADAAVYGFWQATGDETADFELRFYPSHQAAISDGTALADEVTGPDAVVTDADSTWKEGVKDRRTSGFTIGGGGGSLAPKYGDYMIYGNVIVMCQGRDSIEALARCDKLVSQLSGN
jgi:hypothetical protein